MGRSITVSGTSLRRENIAELAKEREIWISKIDDGSPAFTDESWAFLAEVIRTTTSLEQLVFQRRTAIALQNKKVIDALVNDYRIKILDLWKAYCGDKGAKAVAAILKENSTIDFVRLGHNDIGVEGAKAIADALKVNKTLRHIDLSSNDIGVEGAKAIADTLKYNKELRFIDLDNNHIGDEGVKAIADALKVNPLLQELGILSNNIGEKGGKYILNTLHQIGLSAIENIDLRWNQISSRTEGRINQEMIRIKKRYKGVGANEGKTAANTTAAGESQGVSNGDEGMSTIHATNASQVSTENVQQTNEARHNTTAMKTEVECLKSTIAKQQEKIAEQDREITSMKDILKTNGEIVSVRHGGTTSNASNHSIPNLAIASMKDIMKTIGYMVNGRRTTSNRSNDDLIPDRETELQSEIERYKQENHSLKEQLKNSRPIETIDLTNEIEPASSSSDGEDSSEEEPPSKRRRMKSNLAVALEVTQQMVKVKEEKKRATVAEANVASARRERDAAEASLRDKQEDLELSEELGTQQTVAINILQGRIDELCELARAAGVDGSLLSEIRYRPLSSGR